MSQKLNKTTKMTCWPKISSLLSFNVSVNEAQGGNSSYLSSETVLHQVENMTMATAVLFNLFCGVR